MKSRLLSLLASVLLVGGVAIPAVACGSSDNSNGWDGPSADGKAEFGSITNAVDKAVKNFTAESFWSALSTDKKVQISQYHTVTKLLFLAYVWNTTDNKVISQVKTAATSLAESEYNTEYKKAKDGDYKAWEKKMKDQYGSLDGYKEDLFFEKAQSQLQEYLMNPYETKYIYYTKKEIDDYVAGILNYWDSHKKQTDPNAGRTDTSHDWVVAWAFYKHDIDRTSGKFEITYSDDNKAVLKGQYDFNTIPFVPKTVGDKNPFTDDKVEYQLNSTGTGDEKTQLLGVFTQWQLDALTKWFQAEKPMWAWKVTIPYDINDQTGVSNPLENYKMLKDISKDTYNNWFYTATSRKLIETFFEHLFKEIGKTQSNMTSPSARELLKYTQDINLKKIVEDANTAVGAKKKITFDNELLTSSSADKNALTAAYAYTKLYSTSDGKIIHDSKADVKPDDNDNDNYIKPYISGATGKDAVFNYDSTEKTYKWETSIDTDLTKIMEQINHLGLSNSDQNNHVFAQLTFKGGDGNLLPYTLGVFLDKDGLHLVYLPSANYLSPKAFLNDEKPQFDKGLNKFTPDHIGKTQQINVEKDLEENRNVVFTYHKNNDILGDNEGLLSNGEGFSTYADTKTKHIMNNDYLYSLAFQNEETAQWKAQGNTDSLPPTFDLGSQLKTFTKYDSADVSQLDTTYWDWIWTMVWDDLYDSNGNPKKDTKIFQQSNGATGLSDDAIKWFKKFETIYLTHSNIIQTKGNSSLISAFNSLNTTWNGYTLLDDANKPVPTANVNVKVLMDHLNDIDINTGDLSYTNLWGWDKSK